MPVKVEAVNEPVLLLHGFYVDEALTEGMYEAKAQLEANGYQVFMPEMTNDIEANAWRLINIVNEINAPKIKIVGVSSGGVAADYYTKVLFGNSKVKQLIFLDSPLYGTYPGNAVCLDYVLTGGVNGGDLCNWSTFIKSLHAGDDTPGNTFYKQIILQPNTDILRDDLLDGGVCSVKLNGVHSEMLFNEALFEEVLEGLQGIC